MTDTYYWLDGYHLKWDQVEVENHMRNVGVTPEIWQILNEITLQRGSGQRGSVYFRKGIESQRIEIRIADPMLADRLGLPMLVEWT